MLFLLQPIPLGVTSFITVSRLKTQSSNVSFALFSEKRRSSFEPRALKELSKISLHMGLAVLPKKWSSSFAGSSMCSQHTETYCNTLLHAATHCYTLLHTAAVKPCNTSIAVAANNQISRVGISGNVEVTVIFASA